MTTGDRGEIFRVEILIGFESNHFRWIVAKDPPYPRERGRESERERGRERVREREGEREGEKERERERKKERERGREEMRGCACLLAYTRVSNTMTTTSTTDTTLTTNIIKVKLPCMGKLNLQLLTQSNAIKRMQGTTPRQVI